MSNAQKVSDKALQAAICQALLDAYPMADKIADNYAAVAAKAVQSLRAAPTPNAHSEVGERVEGFNGGYNPDGTWRWHVFNPDASPLEKKQVELDCMTRLKVIQEGQTEHHRLRAEAAEERVIELEALADGVVKAEPVAVTDAMVIAGASALAMRKGASVIWEEDEAIARAIITAALASKPKGER